ncbi:MAG TPA: hypothetical protein VD788_04950 [Candidatus Polarisedimenticolaceae bacterium]|nr:hypothetical protein [Candidatus Polarisedimenticolaceae bacterium]
MKLPDEIRERFRCQGRDGGRRRARRMSASARRRVAREAATARWIGHRFGSSSFGATGLPGGDLVDAGLADLAAGRETAASLVVSAAAPRLRREGVPLGAVFDDPEIRLYRLLSASEGELAHARYNAYLRRLVSFADACRAARVD